MLHKTKKTFSFFFRFVGPLTTIEINCISSPRLELRTEGEGVSETGERILRIVLLPQQVKLLNNSQRRVFLTGPPGTGKSVVLILQGVRWLQQKHGIHIVSTWDKSVAASILLEHQIKETLREYSGKTSPVSVSTYRYNFYNDDEVNTAISDLCQKAMTEHHLNVIVDEAGPDHRLVSHDILLRNILIRNILLRHNVYIYVHIGSRMLVCVCESVNDRAHVYVLLCVCVCVCTRAYSSL